MGKDGIALWRRVGETLVKEIDGGTLEPGARLPPSDALAARFGVNQHTVLRAISYLQEQGLLRIERGRGTFVVENVIQYRMGASTRFEENLLQLNRVPSRRLTNLADIPAAREAARALEVAVGETITLVSLLGEADGVPISYGHNYFPSARLGGIGAAFRTLGAHGGDELSITAALAAVGVALFRRKVIRVRTRAPSEEEARQLAMPTTENVLEVEATNVDGGGRPVMYATTCFCGSRVEFVLEP